MRVLLRVKPGSARPRVGGRYDGPRGLALVVAVTARAVDGQATRAVTRAVAEAFGLPPRDVRLVAGAASRDKLVELPDELPGGQRTEQVLRTLLSSESG